MSRFRPFLFGRRSGAVLAALVILGAVTAGAQTSAAAPGQIDFETADLPPATVAVDLSQGMIGDLFGIGDAAVAGVAEALTQSAKSTEKGEGAKQAAEQLAAARHIVQLASQVVQGARVRVYDKFDSESGGAEDVFSKFDQQLQAGNWDKLVRVHDGDQNVQIAAQRTAGAIRGVFVIVAEKHQLVLVNVVCDISPERVKELTETATKIGLENGLQPMIEAKMREMHRQWPQGPRHHPEH